MTGIQRVRYNSTGDNHKTFIEKSGKRFLVNPGSMMRMSEDQVNHKPRVFELKYWQHDGSPALVTHYLPIEENVLDRNHIDVKQERDKRINSFVQQLQTNYELGVSFERNLEEFFRLNDVRETVKILIREIIMISFWEFIWYDLIVMKNTLTDFLIFPLKEEKSAWCFPCLWPDKTYERKSRRN